MDNKNSDNNQISGLFKNIVNNANTKLNSEKAAKIKRALILGGAGAALIGGILVITGFVTFMNSNFEQSKALIGIIVFMLGGIIAGLGTSAVTAGIKIVITAIGADIADTYQKCPKCGVRFEKVDAYCDKCGSALLKPKLCVCGRQNNINSVYCKSCGKKL